MTNLKITCDGERIYLQLPGAEPFLLAIDGRGCLVDVLKERLDLVAAILDAGGTCTCLLGELDEGMTGIPPFSTEIKARLVVALAEAALSGDDAAVRRAIIDIAADNRNVPEWCRYFLGLAGEQAARRVLWVRWERMAPFRERREMKRLFGGADEG